MKKIQLLAAKFSTYPHIKTANTADIVIDDSHFEESIKDYLSTIMDKESDIESLTKEALEIFSQNAQKVVTNIKDAISNAAWNGSKIALKPSSYYDSIMRRKAPISWLEDEPWIQVGTIWYIMVDTDISRMSPGFTYMIDGSQNMLGDVLDAGDTDFFNNELVEADYFALVNSLRSLGKKPEKEKIITLFTARPKQERDLYVNKKEVPNNIWLTTNESEAGGIARDLADYVKNPETGETTQEIRDVYMVKINNKYLISTDHPNHFQAYNPTSSTVPVEYIYLS